MEQHNQNKPKKVKVESKNGNSKANEHPKGSKGISKDAHSIEEGKNMFQWIMDGISVDEFMR